MIIILLIAGKHRPTSETTFDGPSLNASLVTVCVFWGPSLVLLRNPTAL